MLNTLNLNQFLNHYLQFGQQLRNQVVVIKYGGAAMKNNDLKLKVIQDILFLYNLGIKLVLVHGGGPMINDWLNYLNIKPSFDKGIRITDAQTMEVVEMVLVGKVNKDLVNLINVYSDVGIGLSGKDANLLSASAMFPDSENLVGKIDHVNTDILNLLLNSGYIPIIASVASSKGGTTYNVNADTVASSIAQSLNADKLILLTDTPGVLTDIHNTNTLQKLINVDTIQSLCQQNIIQGGMVPKVECCINALHNNVASTHIIDGRIEHALLYELLTENRLGSQIII
uniref:Acetylglutamate kinase n=1 Tax=Gayliella sp. TaxID=2575623 RepID=A0A4D6WWC1_9FLOR|nr:acetylglutamate kinase [Gayliella sp.]